MVLEQDRHAFQNKFHVDLAGATGHVTRVNGLVMQVPKVHATSSGSKGRVQYTLGNPVYGTITIEGNKHKDTKQVSDWFEKVRNEGTKGNRKTFSVHVQDQAGQDVRVFDLIDTFPRNFRTNDLTAGSSGALKWTLELHVERLEMK